MWEGCLSPEGVAQIICIPQLILNLVSFAVPFAGVVALAMLIYGGYKIAFSGGDAKQLEGARHTITYAILGLVVVIMSYFIVSFIAEITGVDCLTWFGLTQCNSYPADRVVELFGV